MLLGQDRRRRQKRDLLAVHRGLERGPEGDLRLAVTHVARDQAIHGAGLLHVGLDLLDGAELIGGLLEAERRLELPLPGGVRPEHVAVQDRGQRLRSGFAPEGSDAAAASVGMTSCTFSRVAV